MVRPRIFIGSMGRDSSAWLLLLFLLFGVLAPMGCVLWFMDQVARSQADSARQSVTEAWRGQLRSVRERVDSCWAARETALRGALGPGGPQDFERIVKAGLADSIVFLDSAGAVAYPAPMPQMVPDPLLNNTEWLNARQLEQNPGRIGEAAALYARIAQVGDSPLAARAAQAEIRCLLRGGNREAVLGLIRRHFLSGGAARGFDLQKRLISVDEQLLAVQLMRTSDDRRLPAAQHLAEVLSNYQTIAMPSAQRVFLMNQLAAMAPQIIALLPTRNAEVLAAQFLDSDKPVAAEGAFQRTRAPDLWKLSVGGNRALALYRKETLVNITQRVLAQQNSSESVRFNVIPPGAPAPPEAISAGALLPGWQLSFSIVDNKLAEETARRRMASYLWIGYLVVAATALTGLLAGQSFRRQLRLTRLKTDLVAAVSHELKTPLSSMRLLVDSLLEDGAFDPQKTRDYLGLISVENARLTRLIENFLTFSRIERSRQRFEFTQTMPKDVIGSAVQAMHERLQSPACQLTVELKEDLPPVRADEDALIAVLLNLLDNAWKYSPGEKLIAVEARLEGAHVAFSVEDHGIGIAPREQKRIFRRFYQVDRRLARETGGCGLGLSIVEFIVRAHGGTVRLESRLGEGSKFTVFLPLQEPAA